MQETAGRLQSLFTRTGSMDTTIITTGKRIVDHQDVRARGSFSRCWRDAQTIREFPVVVKK
jgi:hypothetical protein